MDVAIIGTGYVGLVTGTCFAELGNRVICVDNNESKIAMLKKGQMPIYEPGLKEMVVHNLKESRLSFTTDIKEAVKNSKIIFIAVGTPPLPNGEADLSFVEDVACQIARHMTSYRLIVEKSTVPVETGKWVEHTLRVNLKRKITFDVASNPEFLREGSAINDFMHPDRIVLGVETKRAQALLEQLYKPLGASIVVTDIKSAEIIKHASNSFLAAKISFINAIATVCELVGADVVKVAEGMGLDARISAAFLNAGIGFGGSCFPKDIDAFIHIAEKAGYDFSLLKVVRQINEAQKVLAVEKVKQALWLIPGKTIGVWGLAFKPGTDDMRLAPAIDIINALQAEGAKVQAFDPQAMSKARNVLKKIAYCKGPYEAARGADCLIIATEWNEFKTLDLEKVKRLMKQPIVVDGRNMYDPAIMRKLGFTYIGIGRGYYHPLKRST
ncbi:MAG: UDP-glucose/GDP-mannose dehydrogenase family protein [Candidatus Omnitrophica bacterium]|nr:UDP-glucose/GDP-mannose dehydrogenase family protein [Candidatus Omnitrophota bacterium]